jgi:hypothetical protein
VTKLVFGWLVKLARQVEFHQHVDDKARRSIGFLPIGDTLPLFPPRLQSVYCYRSWNIKTKKIKIKKQSARSHEPQLPPPYLNLLKKKSSIYLPWNCSQALAFMAGPMCTHGLITGKDILLCNPISCQFYANILFICFIPTTRCDCTVLVSHLRPPTACSVQFLQCAYLPRHLKIHNGCHKNNTTGP